MPVAQTASSAAQEFHFLTVVGNLTEVLSRLSIENHSTAWHVDDNIVAILAETASARTALTVAGEYVAAVFKRQKRPHITVAPENDVSSAAAVSAVGTTLGHVFGTIEMARAGAALSRAAEYLHIVDEI